MKNKFFFTLAACLYFGNLFAENIIQIKPVNIEPNISIENEDCGTLEVVIYSSAVTDISGLEFDLYIPNALSFDKTYVYEGDALPYTTTKKGVKTYLHTVSVEPYAENHQDKEGYKRYKTSIFSMSGTKLTGDSGESLLTFDFGTGNEVGLFPVYVDNIIMAISSTQNQAEIDHSTSYIKVGTPSNATLALKGVIPSFVNSALATETAISTLDLTNVTASNGTFTYVDGRTVVAPIATVNSTVAYNHAAATENSYYSFRLPFAANVDCYTLGQIDGGTAHFSLVSTLSANTSAIAKDAINIEESGVALKGVAPTEAMTGFYYLGSENSQSVLRKYTGTATSIPAFRGYWQGGQASNLRITFEDETTGISALETEEAENTFDLQGRRVANASNGVFIVNGKKIIK